MKLGILGAMPQEIEAIVREFVRQDNHVIAGRNYHTGTFSGKEAVLAFSRWGKVAAAMTATVLIERFGVDLIIFTGVAGGIDERLNVGDVVIADKLIQHDFDASLSGMCAQFEIPLLGVSRFPVEKHLVVTAKQAADRYLERAGKSNRASVGTIGSGDEFVAQTHRVESLRKAIPELLCGEMDAAAVAQVRH